MNLVLPQHVPFDDSLCFTDVIKFWQQPRLSWRKKLRRVGKQYRAREHMMTHFTEIQEQFFKVFQQAGAAFDPDKKRSVHQRERRCICCPYMGAVSAQRRALRYIVYGHINNTRLNTIPRALTA